MSEKPPTQTPITMQNMSLTSASDATNSPITTDSSTTVDSSMNDLKVQLTHLLNQSHIIAEFNKKLQLSIEQLDDLFIVKETAQKDYDILCSVCAVAKSGYDTAQKQYTEVKKAAKYTLNAAMKSYNEIELRRAVAAKIATSAETNYYDCLAEYNDNCDNDQLYDLLHKVVGSPGFNSILRTNVNALILDAIYQYDCPESRVRGSIMHDVIDQNVRALLSSITKDGPATAQLPISSMKIANSIDAASAIPVPTAASPATVTPSNNTLPVDPAYLSRTTADEHIEKLAIAMQQDLKKMTSNGFVAVSCRDGSFAYLHDGILYLYTYKAHIPSKYGDFNCMSPDLFSGHVNNAYMRWYSINLSKDTIPLCEMIIRSCNQYLLNMQLRCNTPNLVVFCLDSCYYAFSIGTINVPPYSINKLVYLFADTRVHGFSDHYAKIDKLLQLADVALSA